jgi:cyclase
MDITQVTPRVYVCLTHNTTSNAGFILTRSGPIVVDTLNTPAAGRELAARATEIADRPPVLVINTHFHFDHTFGNQAFACPIAAHESLAPTMAARIAGEFSPAQIAEHVAAHPEDAWLRNDLRPVYPQIGFTDHLMLDFGGPQVTALHLGGHTPCLSVVHVPSEAVVFASDLLFMGRTPFMRFADSISQWIRGLERIEAMNADVVVPGHGEVATTADVARFRQYLSDLWGTVGRLVREGRTKEEVSRTSLPLWADDRPDLHQANVERLYDLAVAAYSFVKR